MNNRNFGLDVVRMCAIVPVLVGHFSEFALTQVPTILSVGADLGVIFDLRPEQRLSAAMSLLGVDLTSLSDDVGHA